MTGLKRAMFDKVQYLMKHFPIVAILGARQIGKTTLAKQVAPNFDYFDLEKPSDYQRISQDPELFFHQNPNFLILDEAQIFPGLFPLLRGVVDANRDQKGRFIITGSSSPELLNNISESLAGRIAIIELVTLKVSEFMEQPLSPFYKILKENQLENLVTEKPKLSFSGLSKEAVYQVWCRGGYPEPLLKLENEKDAVDAWFSNYQLTYLNRDVSRFFPRLNQRAYQHFLKILSHLSGTIINRSQVARDLEVSEATVREYLSIVEGTFLWRQLHSYEGNVQKALVKMPRGYFRDTGLLHHLLGLNTEKQLTEHPVVGRSFESFVIEEILKGLEATLLSQWKYSYYRTRAGSEIDFVLSGSFGVLPIEIKYGIATPVKQLSALSKFIEEENLPMGILVNQAPVITWLTPKILQWPIWFL